jgi:hypothetical protein
MMVRSVVLIIDFLMVLIANDRLSHVR